MTCGIYQIRNTVNGKVYIGSSTNVEGRWRTHKCALRKKTKKASPHLQAAWIKYGESAFVFEIINSVPVDKLKVVEAEYISWIPANMRYNITTDTDVPIRGHKM